VIHRKNGTASFTQQDLTLVKGTKHLVVEKCGGDVSLLSRATELTGRPQPLTMMMIMMMMTSPFRRRNYCCEVFDSHDPSVHSDKIQRQVPVALEMKEDIFIL
jgi:hypothetical protein